MYEELPAPPFRPDLIPAETEPPLPEGNPAEVFAGLGVSLPELTQVGRTVNGLPVWVGEVEAGYSAASLWTVVRDLFPRTGWWPVLTDPRTFEGLDEAEPNAAAVGELDGARWLGRAWTDATEGEGETFPRSHRPLTAEDIDHDGFDWADAWNIVGDDYETIALVPAPAHWLVPHLVNWWGACNYDFGGADHASMLRRWSGHWRAELLALGGGTVVLRVDAPPSTDADALAVAVEHHLYCPDSVHQGVSTIDRLKPHTAAPLWHLWWD